MTTHDRKKVIAASKKAGVYSEACEHVFGASLERFYAIAHEAGRVAEREDLREQLADNHKQVTMLRKLVGEIYCRNDAGPEIMRIIEDGLNAITRLKNGEL